MLKKLSKAYSTITNDDLPGTTNPVESINRQSIPENVKLVSLKPLVEHIYLEDKRHAVLQLTSQLISYEIAKTQKRSRRLPKPLEKQSSLMTGLNGKQAIGTRLSVELSSLMMILKVPLLGIKGPLLHISHDRVTLSTLMDAALKKMR